MCRHAVDDTLQKGLSKSYKYLCVLILNCLQNIASSKETKQHCRHWKSLGNIAFEGHTSAVPVSI